jgi:excisionase family DNA binding protein
VFLTGRVHGFRMTSAPTPTGSAGSASVPGVSSFLTAGEVADRLRVGTYQVVELCREGKLRATKPGKMWLILPADLEAYIAAGYNDAESA